MHQYTLQAYVKRADGSLHKFLGRVSAPRKIGAGFICKVKCSLWRGIKTFHSEWPEMVYSDACNAVRFALDDQQVSLCNRKGDAKEFSPPLTISFKGKGRSKRAVNFPAVRFKGDAVYLDARRESAFFAVGPVKRDHKGKLFHVIIRSNFPGFARPTKSHWPDQAYALAFYRIRMLLEGRRAELGDTKGRPIIITARIPSNVR